MRQVNGWGFHRISEGVGENSYSHKYFLRDSPHLCLKMSRLNQKAKSSDPMKRKKKTRSLPDRSSLSPNSNESQSSSFSNGASVRNTAVEGPSMPVLPTLNRNNLHFLHELYQNRTPTQYQTHRVETFGLNGIQPLSMPPLEIYSSLPQLADLNSNVLPLTDSLDVYELQHLQWQQHLVKERIKHRLQLVRAGIISVQPQPQNRLNYENLFSAL